MKVPVVDGRVVLLPSHSHPEFGDPNVHYHIDFDYDTAEPRQDDVLFSNNEPIFEERPRIRREAVAHVNSAFLQVYLQNKYRGQESKCGRCPHKGLPVRGGICTGHGLAFDDKGIVEDGVWLAVSYCSVRHHITDHTVARYERYDFDIEAEGSVRGVAIQTQSGRQIGFVTFKDWIPVMRGDILKVSLS